MDGFKGKYGSLLTASVLVVSILCLFQNCSPSGVKFDSTSSALAAKGNGDIYGGKPQNYVLTLDDGQCLDGTNLDSLISLQDNRYMLMRKDCQNLDPAVEISGDDIQVLPESLVYQDRIYISQETDSADNSESGDLWCQEQAANPMPSPNSSSESLIPMWYLHVSSNNGSLKVVSFDELTYVNGQPKNSVILRDVDLSIKSKSIDAFFAGGQAPMPDDTHRMGSVLLEVAVDANGLKAKLDLPRYLIDGMNCRGQGGYFLNLFSQSQSVAQSNTETGRTSQ